jgi:hypothetical protein
MVYIISLDNSPEKLLHIVRRLVAVPGAADSGESTGATLIKYGFNLASDKV